MSNKIWNVYISFENSKSGWLYVENIKYIPRKHDILIFNDDKKITYEGKVEHIEHDFRVNDIYIYLVNLKTL